MADECPLGKVGQHLRNTQARGTQFECQVLHANVQFLAPRRAQAATLHKSAETLLDGGAAHLPKQARNMLGIGADEVVKIDLKRRILT